MDSAHGEELIGELLVSAASAVKAGATDDAALIFNLQFRMSLFSSLVTLIDY